MSVRENNYLFITYMVTSKPKRISVAAGLVHMIDLLVVVPGRHRVCPCESIIGPDRKKGAIADHEQGLGNFMKHTSCL